MIDQQVQKYIDDLVDKRVSEKLGEQNKLNAAGILFDPSTGLHTQGKNLVGLTGDRAVHNSIRTNLTKQTIVSGVIQFISSDIAVDTESAAASDDLDTILPGTMAQGRDILILSAYNDARTVVVKNGTGNIICAGDFSMDSINDRIILQWDKINSKWIEISRYDASDTDYATWTPTCAAVAPMTFTVTTLSVSRWKRNNRELSFYIDVEGTTAVAGSISITFTLPVTPANSNIGGGCWITDGLGLQYGGTWHYNSATSVVEVIRYDFANWGLGTNRRIRIDGHYEVA